MASNLAGTCAKASSDYYQSTRARRNDREQSAAQLLSACDLGSGKFGWTPSEYDGALASILKAESLHLDGFIGASFGANRLTYLRTNRARWALLATPAHPPGTSAAFLQGRLDAAVEAFESCGQCAIGGRSPIARAELRAAALDMTPARAPARSVPVTGSDVGAALFGLAASPEGFQDQAPLLLEDSAAGAEKIGQLSDFAWGRYGVTSISDAYLAYLDEVCPMYLEWNKGLDLLGQSRAAVFLYDYHRPCLGLIGELGAIPPSELNLPMCIVSSPADRVTGAAAAVSWHQAVRGSQLVSDPDGTHGSPRLNECLTLLS